MGEKAINQIQEQLGSNKKSEIRNFQLEITDEKHCKNLANHLKKEHGGLDVLINNAGYAFNVSFLIKNKFNWTLKKV